MCSTNRNRFQIFVTILTIVTKVTFCEYNEIVRHFQPQMSTIHAAIGEYNESLNSIKSIKSIKIGYLTNMNGDSSKFESRQGLAISGAITYAMSKINANSTLLNGRKLELIYNDTSGSIIIGTAALLDQWKKGVVAFFGPEDSCNVEATIAAALNLPMISYKCADSKMSQKDFYSTFVRTHPSETQVVRSVIALLSYYKWKKFSILWENKIRYETVVKSLTDQAIARQLTINSEKKFENFHECCMEKKPCCEGTDSLTDIIEETYRNTRIYVFLGNNIDLMQIMRILRMRGLLENGEYIVIYVDLEEDYRTELSYKYISTQINIKQDEKRALIEAAQSLLVIVPSPPNVADYTAFEDKVREFNQKSPFNNKELFEHFKYKRHITIYASYLYDSIMLYSEALSQAFKEGFNEYQGKAIIQKIINRKRYLSVTGAWMNIDKNGDVEGNYTVLARMPTPDNIHLKGMNGSNRPSHVMLPVGNFEYDETINETLFKLEGYINWVSGNPPLEEPPCGFDGSGCKETKDFKREIFACILAAILGIVFIIVFVTYRNWKYEQEIAGLLWKINLRDIQFYAGTIPLSTSKMSIASQASIESKFHSQVFTQTATYKGTIVAVKQLRFPKRNVDLSRNVKKEMKLMKEFRHDNINLFIGAYIEPSCVFIVTEYCAKGSLYDILENDDLKLDSMFIASLVFDLISGMTYIHDSDLKCHGNLKSSNCIVTSRWVLQITDFGLHQLRANAETDSNNGYNYYRNLLWKAPELLRRYCVGGTQKGDIYAFAIILHEIIAREGPFGLNSSDVLTAKEIIHKVKEICSEDCEPLRPDTSLIQCQDYVLQTMRDCWSENPDERPDIRTVRHKLKKLRQGLKANIMDNIMAMMERYANNLEEIVEERTAQLVEEKKKTEALLDRMLPKSVAAQLMRGEFVIPESFDAVTIFFSDIVGFTSMSASSTPMEVVTFLNDLYTLFDSIICNYDVYKVETIGDAYMVVSGLPIRNGDKHASEIASMALELLESVSTFKIRHKQQDILQLRIGIHTGAVVTGVVGTTMPRYCLFGDTVNTASRMESNGEALKIHISQECKSYLVKLGGYIIEDRGMISMKGKGEVNTYWLMGHTKGELHRRESIPDVFLHVPTYPYSGSDIKSRRSPIICDLPRKGSLVTFKSNKTSGSNVNISHSRLPAFLRLKSQQISNNSIKANNSPKPSKKILKQSRLSRDQISENEISMNQDIASNHVHQNNKANSRCKLKKSSSFIIKECSHSNLVDCNNTAMNRNDCLLENDQNCETRHSRYSSTIPLINSKDSNEFSNTKKWHSCTELSAQSFRRHIHNNDNNNAINSAKANNSFKDWLRGIVKPNKILTDEIKNQQNNSILIGRSSNCDYVALKPSNDCDMRLESVV